MKKNYFNDFNVKFSHGIMFHHFHDKKKHLPGQGSITAFQLKKLINYIGKKNIISPSDFLENIKSKKNSNKVCLTFDDALKCQYDIALPVLEEYKIKAFFFIYSNVLDDKPDLLEIYRYFRLNYFKNVNDFYTSFYDVMLSTFPNLNKNNFLKRNYKILKNMKIKAPFYTNEDIKFRIIRDQLLGKSNYNKIMLILFDRYEFKYKKIFSNLFLNKTDIKKLHNKGHEIGLHSHSHPTLINGLNYQEQKKEYNLNKQKIKKVLKNKSIVSMSHPCGMYSKNTLLILKKLNIKIGFRDNMIIDKWMKKINPSIFEIARQDHSNIINFLNK